MSAPAVDLVLEELSNVYARTRAELDAARTQLRFLATVPDAGTFVWPDTSVPAVVVSPPLREVLAVAPECEAVHPELLFERMHPDDHARVRKHIDEHFARGGAYTVDYRLCTPDGRERRARTYGEVVHGEGGTTSVYGLTSVVEHERELRLARELRRERTRAERRLLRVMRAGGVCTWEWNVSTGALEVADLGTVFQGEHRGALPGPWRRFVHPDDADALAAALAPLREPDRRIGFEGRFRLGDEYCHYLLRGRSSRSAAEAVTAVGTLVDVDERVRATQRLERVNARLKRFGHAVAHDLQAPLRHIAAFAELVSAEHGERLDAESAELIDSIRRSGQRAHAMVADLLTYAERDGEHLDVDDVDLNALVASIREEFGADPAAAAATWAVDELPVVVADATQARELLANLLSNAVKFSAGQPAPRVEVCSEAPTPAEAAAGVAHVVVVRDNGVGFDEDEAAELFAPFHRGRGAEACAPGTGIGLSTVAEVAAAHGWRIRAEGKKGEGATFRVLMG